MEASLTPQSNHAIMDDLEEEGEEEDELGSMSSFSDIDDDDEEVNGEGSSNSVGSSSSDFTEVDASSSTEGPLFEMTSLLLQLPFKKGLSKHFEGKSQSFTSLSNAKSLEDLVKPERPLLLFRRSRQLKASRSCGWGLGSHSRAITKKSSRGSFSSSLGSSGGMKRSASSLLGSRPPIPP